MANRNINFGIGFSVDKSGLNELTSLLEAVQVKADSINPGQKIDQGLKDASSTAKQLESILQKTYNADLGTINITRFNQELNKSNLTIKSIQTDLTKAGNVGATAYNRLSQAIIGTNMQLKESNRLLDSMATTMVNTVKWGITSSIFNTITNSISKAYSYVKQLDTSLNDIRIVTGKSADEMDNFAEKANKAAKNLSASTLDYTKASLIYYQQGLSDEEAQARAETTVKVANVTGQTGDAVSEQLTAVWNGYKVSAQETEQYVDKLAAVAATTAADLEELSKGMSKVASAANAMGVDFDDLNAQIATIVSVTRQAPESVGTALKTIYARLGDLKVDGVDEFGVKLGEVSSQLKTMGIEILDTNGDMRDMTTVMTEVAEKWNTWTRAQQQAAAVAMAGKRQYNNLVALFENWDMYSDALETSKNSLGTLQEQQDIYMESTAAKLKELKATWQSLYQGLIKTDEINTGIQALTDLVDLGDKFIRSFGGGIKAVGAFGAIFSNIFSKQISKYLTETIQKQEVIKQNLQLAQLNESVRANGVQELGADATNQQVAAAENSKVQLEYAERIYQLKSVINQEDYNTLVNYQKQLGALQEEITLEEKKLNKKIESSKLDKEILEKLKEGYGLEELLLEDSNKLVIKQENFLEYVDSTNDSLKTSKLSVSDIIDGIDNIKTFMKSSKGMLDSMNGGEQEIYEKLIKTKVTQENIYQTKKDLVNVIKIIEKYNNKELDSVKALEGIYTKLNQLKAKQSNIKGEFEAIEALLQKGKTATQVVTGITSALGSFAMAWGSLNSLMEVWNDKEKSFGDKMLQSFTSLSMLVPTIISSISKLNSVFDTNFVGIFTYLQRLTQVKKTAMAVDKASNAIKIAEAALNEVIAAQGNTEVQTILRELAAKGALTSEEEIYEALQAKGIAQTEIEKVKVDELIASYSGLTAAKGAAGKASAANENAVKNLASSSLWGVIAAAVVALIMGGIFLAVRSRAKELEKLEQKRTEIKEKKNKIEEDNKEIESNKKLVNSYLEVYNKYKQGIATKDELSDSTENLIGYVSQEQIAIANLTGNYEQLAEAAKNARIEQEKQESLNYQNAFSEEINKVFEEHNTNRMEEFSSGYIANLSEEGKEELKNLKYFNFDEDFNELTMNKDAFANMDYKGYQEYVLEYNKLKNLGKYIENENLATSYQDEFNSAYGGVKNDVSNLVATFLTPKAKTDLQLAIDENVDLENNKNYQDFEKDFYEAKKFVEESGMYQDDEIFDKTLELIQGITSSNDQYVDQLRGMNFLVDKYKESFPEKTEDQIAIYEEKLKNLNKEDLVYLLNLDVSLDEESLDEVLNQIKAKTAVEQNELGIDLAEGFRENLAKDQSKMSKKDKERLEEERQAFSDQYNLDNEWWEKFDASKPIDQMSILNELIEKQNKELIKNQDTLNENQDGLEEKQKNLTETSKNLQNQLKNTPAGPAFEELSKAVEKTNKDLEVTNALIDELDVDIPIEDQLIELFDNRADGIISIAEKAKSAAELIGEGFTVAAEDAQELLSQYPELYNAAEVLANGDIKLNQEVVKTVLGGNEEVIKSNSAVTEKRLEEEIAVLQAQINFNQAKMKILDQYLKGEITNQEKENKINKAGAQFEEDLIAAVGQDQYDAAIQAAKNNEELTDATLKNFATMIDGADQLSQAIQQALKGEAVTASVEGLSGTGGSFSDYQKYASVASTKTVLDNAAAAAEAERQMKALKEETASYEKALAETQFTLSKLRSGTSASVEAMENVMAGKAGKKDKSSSKSKEEKEKDIDEEFDRYWEYKKAIDMLDKSMARLQKTQSKLHGKELIDSLKKENELLEQQKANYDALIHAQEREAGELQGHLMYYGAAFNANGELANYADLTSKMLEEYSNAIQQYNSGALDKNGLQIYEKQYEDFKKTLERYDTLYYSEIQDTLDKLDEARRKQLENNLKSWETEIQIKLDLTEAERNWNDFIRDVEQDFRKIYEDLTIESAYDTANFDTYVDDLNTTLQAIHDVENEITKLASTGKSDMFESMSEAQEKLKDLGNELIENGKSLYELYESVWNNYINKLDQAADNLKDINDEFGHITNELEYERKLIELIYGDKAYDKMTKYYDAQQKNINMQIDSLKTQRDFWENQFQAAYMMNKDEHNVILNDMSTWTEDMRKAYDQMIESQESLNDKITEGIENLTDNYLNKLAETFDKLENAVWNMNLDALSDDWDRITGLADEYLDDVEGIYQIQTLANKIDKDIDNTSDIKAAQKLQAFREKEIAILKQKDNLTQTDVDLAEARYQIMLKEIALEDAQNAKNSMKLTRNTSGNWTYQYVADDEDVADKKQDLLQGYQDLYKMADDAYQHSMELLMNTWQEMQEKMQEAAELYKNDSEKLAEEQLKIRESYAPMMEAAAENSELYRQEAITASSAVFSETCDQDAETYQYLTDLQKELVDGVKDKHLEDYEAIRSAVIDGVYPEIAAVAESAFLETNLNSSTAAADIIHQWADDDGESVKAKINEAIDSIEDNVKEFEDELDNMKEVAGTDFENVDEYINTTIGKIGEMEEKTKKMTDKSEQEIDELRQYVEQLGVAFGGILDNIYDATKAMASYKDAVGLVNEELRGLIITAQEWTGLGFDPSAAGLGGNKTKIDDNPVEKKYKIVSDPNGAAGTIGIQYLTGNNKGQYRAITKDVTNFTNVSNEQQATAEKRSIIAELKKRGIDLGVTLDEIDFSNFTQFASGGYTGDWSSDHGALAILHNKELVLNEDDTSNFLKATSLLRDISKINGSIEDSIMASILGMMNALNPRIGGFSASPSGSQESSGNIFNITAEFPNANDVTSIREAILSLPNIASQYVHQR